MTYEDPETGQGYFSMMLYPPGAKEALVAQSHAEMRTFVLDQLRVYARQAYEAGEGGDSSLRVDNLKPTDTFQVIRFSSNASKLGDRPLLATREKRLSRARDYVRRLSGNGGTVMIEGIRAALEFPHES